jgi:signal transduction histidine kinase
MSTAFARLVGRAVVPRTTVRWRLTLLYGGMFLVCGAVLLAITYTLVDHATVTRTILAHPHGRPPTANRARPVHSAPTEPRSSNAFAIFVTHQQRIHDLHQLVVWSAIALAVMTVASMLLGWVVAGRVLAPLREITATTKQISAGNLHERLALAGPRDELTQLADTIDGLLERLDGSFESQRRFVANASHELRTPLAMMRTFLDVAIAKPDGAPAQTRALDADLRGALDHADRLLESFLVLARAEHGELGERQRVAVEQLVTAALRDRAGQIAAKKIDVNTALHPVRVVGSETLLVRMVENVIENAIRHNQDHGSIAIALTLDGTIARLVVDSDGDPLEEQAVAQLGQPFRRVGRDRVGSQNGHGLGLSIVAAIAAAHDGMLELHARRQGGLRVEISLPNAAAARTAGTIG